jgi:uncharacterized membrane protein
MSLPDTFAELANIVAVAVAFRMGRDWEDTRAAIARIAQRRRARRFRRQALRYYRKATR